MTAAEDNPDSASAEEFLWSLGVGEALPQWLKEQRRQERERGLNQVALKSPQIFTRPGIGPHRPVQSTEAGDPNRQVVHQDPAPRVVAAPHADTRDLPVAPKPEQSLYPVERRVDPDDGKAYSLEGLRQKYKGLYSEEEIASYFRQQCRPQHSGPAGAGPAAVAEGDGLRGSAGPATPATPVAPATPTAASRPAAPAAPLASVGAAGPAVPAERPAAPSGASAAAAALRRGEAQDRSFNVSIKDWLVGLDESGFLTQYHDAIASKLDSLEQLVDIYVQEGGVVDPQFFVDTGIKKLGHKRLFEKWFKDKCGNRCS